MLLLAVVEFVKWLGSQLGTLIRKAR